MPVSGECGAVDGKSLCNYPPLSNAPVRIEHGTLLNGLRQCYELVENTGPYLTVFYIDVINRGCL
jgi:hypothetical protein